jgi:hypothetical protein
MVAWGGARRCQRHTFRTRRREIGLEFTFFNLLFVVIVAMPAGVTILIMRYVGELMAEITTEV